MARDASPPVIVSGRGVVLGDALRREIGRKVARLARLRPRALDARVRCTAEKFGHTVRVSLRARRRTFASAATADEVGAALDAALEALRRQLREAKERRRHARRAAGPAA